MNSPDSCPTVVVVGEKSAANPQGVREINKSDFNAEIHTLFEGVVERVQHVAAEVVAEVEAVTTEIVDAVKPAGWGEAPPA